MKNRILVVDEDVSARGFLRELLRGEGGYRVTTLKDGYGIIKRMEKNNFKAIFLDLDTPGIGDVRLYKAIKTTNPDVHIILMTAHLGNKKVKEGMEAGAYGCIHKPFDPNEILTMLRHII